MSATKTHSTTTPTEALRTLVERLEPVETEQVPLGQAAGRVLAEPLKADRDSPPATVSAMDGYALRLSDLGQGRIAVAGEVGTGQAPLPLPPQCAVRIFTGGCVPDEAEAVVPREEVREEAEAIELRIDADIIRPGWNIRRQGENLRRGELVAEAGREIDCSVAGALAAFGAANPCVYRKVRVGLLITGDELRSPSSTPEPWQIRDSNGPAVQALLAGAPWIELVQRHHALDHPADVRRKLEELVAACDAVLITGGVSMGDYDHVPEAVMHAGGTILFHRLRIRPGKPVLGAVGPQGQAVLGLPGNPVSVLVTARRFAVPALRRLGGFTEPERYRFTAQMDESTTGHPELWWYRPVVLEEQGTARVVAMKGSGDLVGSARSDGFVEIPPDRHGHMEAPYWPWRM